MTNMEKETRFQKAKRERSKNPAKRDQYLRRMAEAEQKQLDFIRANRDSMTDFEYESYCEELEYFEREAVGVEGVDF